MNEVLTTLQTITPFRPWGIDIPNYFWFTGSSAAAFIISSFAHVFGKKEFKPIAGFSLLLAFVLLVAAPMNLIDDLKQPARLMNFFLYGWENFLTSPMKWGVLLLMAYPILIFFEALILYREFFANSYHKAESKFGKFIYKIACLGRVENDELNHKKDHRLGYILGAIGIPLTLCVHGYTGYILAVVYSIPLWHTAIMPILFLASAMVSGTGLLIVLLPIFQRYFTDFKKVDIDMMDRLMLLLSWFIVIDLVVRFFWLTFAMPFNNSEQYIIKEFFSMHFNEVFWVEYVICLIIPMIIGFIKPIRRNLSIAITTGIVCAAGVWLFRWNTVIGGQSMPKSGSGFLEYTPHLVGQDSIFSVIGNWGLFIGLLCFIMALFPWDKEMSRYY